MATTFKVTGYSPFTVVFTNGESSKTLIYDVALTNKELKSEADFIVFDEDPILSGSLHQEFLRTRETMEDEEDFFPGY